MCSLSLTASMTVHVVGDDLVMSSNVADGGTAQEGKGVHTDTVSGVDRIESHKDGPVTQHGLV